jgi:hypothetical protein
MLMFKAESHTGILRSGRLSEVAGDIGSGPALANEKGPLEGPWCFSS